MNNLQVQICTVKNKKNLKAVICVSIKNGILIVCIKSAVYNLSVMLTKLQGNIPKKVKFCTEYNK